MPTLKHTKKIREDTRKCILKEKLAAQPVRNSKEHHYKAPQTAAAEAAPDSL